MTEVICQAEGNDGTVRLYEDRVEIDVENSITSFHRHSDSDKVVPLENIGNVNFRSTGWLSPGYIDICPIGHEGQDMMYDSENGGYAVHFHSGNEGEFEELRDKIRNLMQSTGDEDKDDEDPLKILEQRYARGEISENEFKQKRDVLRE